MCLSVSCLLCHPTFASVTVHPQFILSHWLRALRPMQRSQVPNLCKALLQTKMLPAVVELVTGGGAHQFMYDPHPLLSSVSGNSDSCMLLEKKKKNDLQTNTYLWQECALEQNEAKISHLNTICKRVYKYALWLNLSSF